jgi:hypothetical protein
MRTILAVLALATIALAGVGEPEQVFFPQPNGSLTPTCSITQTNGSAITQSKAMRSQGRILEVVWKQWTSTTGESTAVRVLCQTGLPELGPDWWSSDWDTVAIVYGTPAESTLVRARVSYRRASIRVSRDVRFKFEVLTAGSDTTSIGPFYFYGDDLN